MKQQHKNRRVRMTKRMMKDGLLELLEEKDIVNISVTAICETADVHRSTFYHYYTDPADLLSEIEQEILDQIPSPPEILDQQNQNSLLAATSDFFDHLKEDRKTLRILFDDASGNHFYSRMVEHLCNGYIPVGENTNGLSADFTRLYIANGTVGLLREWINKDCPLSSQEIAEMMYTLSKRISQYP